VYSLDFTYIPSATSVVMETRILSEVLDTLILSEVIDTLILSEVIDTLMLSEVIEQQRVPTPSISHCCTNVI
jgi:hypothetical protein